jgi:hypothetical protein
MEDIKNTEKIMERFSKEELEDIINIFETNSTKKAIPPLYQRYGLKLKETRALYAELVQAGLARDHLRDRWTVEQTMKLKTLVEQGYNISEIADFFKKGKDTVRNKIVKEYGRVPFIELPGEEWRDTLSLEGYQVSNKGRVRDKETQIVYKGTLNKRDGGLEFKACKMHRLVAEVFIPNPENKPYVDHIDTDRTNNDVTNLRWVTQEENMRNEQTRENLRKGWEKRKKTNDAIALIKLALELVPDKLELIQLVIECSPKTTIKETE